MDASKKGKSPLKAVKYKVFQIGPTLSLEVRGFVDTVTSQASFCLAVTSGFNGFDETKYLVLTLS